MRITISVIQTELLTRHIPTQIGVVLPRQWRDHDLVTSIAGACRRAGLRRVVGASVSKQNVT